MAPVDWDEIVNANIPDLEDDAAEKMYEGLAEFDPGGEDDAEKLKRLFLVAQHLMNLKAAQAEVAEEQAAEEAKATGKRDKELNEIRRDKEALEREMKDVKRFGTETVGASAPREMRYVREELNEMEHQVALLQRENKEKDRQLADEREDCDRYRKRAEDAERELREVKRENEQVRDDIRDYQRQIESQRDLLLSKRDDDSDYRDKMSSKNKLLGAALEENRNLAESNAELGGKIEEMKKELKAGRIEIERTTDDYLKLKMVVQQSDNMLDQLRKENEILKDQVDDLMEQVGTKADADDQIMVQVNNKVEEWKAILADKDDKIIDLQQQVMQLREQLIAANMDSEKASVAALTKALEERDKQIISLKARLETVVGDLDMNAALMDDVRNELHKSSRGPGDHQMKKIASMQSSIRIQQDHLKDAELRAQEAEADARAKDKELSDALERMRQYESGEYGLAEAVAEIKEWKVKVSVRDRQIEELTQYVNKVEMQVNDLLDENEGMREKLGLDPRKPMDMTEFKKKKTLRLQGDRALNMTLQQEIEKLEEERVSLKLQMRKLAQSTGQKAVALGLSADDMIKVDNFIEELKEQKEKDDAAEHIKKIAEADVLQVQKTQLDHEVQKSGLKLDHLRKENSELKAKVSECEEENENLQKAMKEIHSAIKEQGEAGSGGELNLIHCPTLEKMLAAIEAKNLVGRYDTSLYLKAQVDNLTGHNEELRAELKEARFESTKANIELEKAKAKVDNMGVELKALREDGAGGHFQAMPLPDGMSVTSSDVIASLNEHLVQVMQELSLKEDMIGKMEISLESYRRKFAVMRHQQSLIYTDFINGQKEWESEREKMEGKMKNIEGEQEDSKTRLVEFDRLLDTLSQEEPEVRRRLADMTRKITVLRVNEKALTRRYTAMQEMEGGVRKENNKLKNEMIQMETAVQERLSYLQRYKDMASFKMASLQKTLDDSVPAAELDLQNRKFTELTEKYRDLLEKSNSLVVHKEATTGFESEIKRLEATNSELTSHLEIEKEKLHTLEAAFENMRKQGMMTTSDLSSSDVLSMSKKVTTLEMKELNERQRADHAVRMYDQQKQQLRHLEDRNFELEQKFSDVTKMNLESQKMERELRDELANSVTKAVSDADRRRINELERTEASLRNEMAKLKDIAEVASSQARALDAQQASRDKEVLSLRQQLLDFQAQSDEKTVIGKLHRHIVQLQVSEGTAVKKLEDSNKKNVRLEAQVLQREHKLDDKDQTIYHNRLEARSKAKYLKHTIQDLRRKYSGSVPLPQQEKFSNSMIELQNGKSKIEEELKKTNEERLKVEDKLAELELQHNGLQDLIATLKDGRGAQKVAEWHSKMEQLRLEQLKQKRLMERQKEQAKFLENVIKKHEAEVVMLEEEKVRQAKEFEERELEWEQREVELERIIAQMERTQAEIAGAASQFDEAVGALPDPKWPVSQQLEHAVTTIKRNVKLVMDAKAEASVFKKQIEELRKEIKARENEVIQRDKVITELRLRLPASEERDKIIDKVTATVSSAMPNSEGYESQQAYKVAQSTVHSLQQRVAQKEETLRKYEELLRQARDDMASMNMRHENELKLLQDKLHSKTDAAFARFRKAAQETVSKPSSAIPTNAQLKRLNELEDMLAEQDNSISAMRDKLSRARQEIQDWKYKYDEAIKMHGEDKERLIEDHGAEIKELEERYEDVLKELRDKEEEMKVLDEELGTQKEKNVRAPTTTMKNMVERLKNQLALKEKQQQALSKALTELRADMVQQAQDDVKANAESQAVEKNIQKVVDKQTKELQDIIEEKDAQLQKAKKELKKNKDDKNSLNSEVEETRHDLSKKENQVRKLKEDKARLETEVEALERKVERMSTMKRQRGVEEGLHGEVEELRRKNRLLQEQVKRTKHQPEKPYEELQAKEQAQPQGSTPDAVARWEESKKWQKMVDRLKSRVKEKDQELEKLHKAHDMTRNILERANRDKDNLEHKLKQASRVPHPPSGAPDRHRHGPTTSQHNLEELRRRNYELEEEVTKLKRQLTLGRDAAFEEVSLRNKFLTEKLEDLEHMMSRRQQASSQDVHVDSAYRDLAEKEEKLQKQILQLSEENIELKFEVEQARKDIPRLKDRIEDLQKYVEVLKQEKEQALQNLGSSTGSSLFSPSGNVRRIGESGKSSRELEKTIALLKKVVERTQQENEQLKRAPGVVTNDQMKLLQMENQGLKNQLEEVREKMGSSLSERYTSHQKGTAKIMSDHDKLRRELIKEKETNEKLRIQLKQLGARNEMVTRDFEESKNKLEIEAAKNLSGSTDQKGWKSTVLTRMYEGKVKALEEDLEKKNKMLSDVKILLREAAEREQSLLHDKEELQQKVSILERFPQGTEMHDSDIIRDYQMARLKIDRLECENRELIHELQILKLNAGGLDDMGEEELLNKLKTHDRLMTENVDLRTQLKASQLEVDKSSVEVEKLRKELENFGPDFFEEIEDLKYNFRESVQKNVQYEEQLVQLGKQFGVSVNVPGL